MKILKYFLIVIVCTVLIGLVVIVYEGSSPYKNSANAFEWEKQVNVFFGNSKMGSSEDCSEVFPVFRTILNAETFGPGSLEALLKGVSTQEKDEGYFTSLNENILVQKFEIKENVAYIDFDDSFNKGIAGSCRIQNIVAQIDATLTDLPDIDSVVISVNGQTEGILEP
jgi:hypothetical protein